MNYFKMMDTSLNQKCKEQEAQRERQVFNKELIK